MKPSSSRENQGFSLVELLVVIMMIFILAAMLLPALTRSRASAEGLACSSNLRQMAIAAQLYLSTHDGIFPPAYTTATYLNGQLTRASWDFTTMVDWSRGGTSSIRPGLLWGEHGDPRIQQCPSFTGADNAGGDPFTGYNYNTSYLGHGPLEQVHKEPARIAQVLQPAATAMFGDGQWGQGANKFMRAPLDDVEGGGDQLSFRYAGTQGFRHQGRTGVAFVDGHVLWLTARYQVHGREAPGTGFLSIDNELYDLR